MAAESPPHARRPDVTGQEGFWIITPVSERAEVAAQLDQGGAAAADAEAFNTVRIEKDRGHEFVPQLVQSFPQEIRSIMLGKPTLEDVFVHRTGHKFWAEQENSK